MRDVWISPNPRAKLQATGVDKAGRRQYLYHADFRAQQKQLKYDKLIRFAEKLPELQLAMGEHMTLDPLAPERICALAVRLINLSWFRVGGDRYAKSSRTYRVTTLRKSHVDVRDRCITFRFQGKHKSQVRTALVDTELGESIDRLLELPGARLFRYELGGALYNLTDRRLNEYVKTYMGSEFSGKDFRTWGGTLLAAIELAERGPVEGKGARKQAIASVTRSVAARLGNTPAVTRASYISPAVIEQYCDGRTIDDFRPAAFADRECTLDRARSGGTGDAEPASLVANARGTPGSVEFGSHFLSKEEFVARKTVLVCDNCGKEVDEARGAVMRITYSDARRGSKQADLCDDCAGKMPGVPAARRGRRPKNAAA